MQHSECSTSSCLKDTCTSQFLGAQTVCSWSSTRADVSVCAPEAANNPGGARRICMATDITLLGMDPWVIATLTVCGRSENWWNCDWWCRRSSWYGGSSNSALWSHDKFWLHQYVGQSSCCNHKWWPGIPGLLRSLRRLAITGWPSFPLYQKGGARTPMFASAMVGNINPEAP